MLALFLISLAAILVGTVIVMVFFPTLVPPWQRRFHIFWQRHGRKRLPETYDRDSSRRRLTDVISKIREKRLPMTPEETRQNAMKEAMKRRLSNHRDRS